ncbi:carotene dioxygenase [Jimgerdemannia flammicorona]|uniref:Carotene dioxygenase n=2 Tax=Jimgerdemannia flammicorona TaxID=994334 RepID=A0A433D105_9FUNG|nr:carotene dioxygenase [Jimgerdemannia flammicorona]RUS33025.1 carotene dioxygenase [Jimgerdemannia flammicorona]
MTKSTHENCPETPVPVELEVKGKLPQWLDGVLYKAGQGVFDITLPNGQTHHIVHPFDGLSQVHRFEFLGASNTVRYNSRYTARGVERRIERGDDTIIMFGQDPCQTTLGRMQSFFHRLMADPKEARKMHDEDPSSESINVTVTPNFPLPKEMTDDKLVVVVKTDVNIMQLIDAETLEPKKLFTYGYLDSSLTGQISAAHHQADSSTSEYFNFTLQFGKEITLSAFSIDASGKTHLFDPIRHPAGQPKRSILPSYIHSFSLTNRYVVFPNYPFYFSWNGLSVLWTGSFNGSIKWDGTRPTLLHVLDRQTRKHVATYEHDAFFAFHTLNAWDDDGDIVFDTCAYENADAVTRTEDFGRTRANRDPKPSTVRRYRLRDVAGVAARQAAGNNVVVRAEYEVRGTRLELARMNPNYERKPYRYAYGIAIDTSTGDNLLKKMDLNGGKGNKVWVHEGFSASEPIFIPNPNGVEEDDGVVLSVVNQTRNGNRCFVIAFDAKTFEEVARAEVGEFKATTLHGSFIDGMGTNVAIN